jgi:Spy/CpxP family protein refolding chaperone
VSRQSETNRKKQEFMKLTKTSLMIGMAATALFAVSPTLHAQEAKESKDAPKRERAPEGKRGEAVRDSFEKMATDLKLSDDQKKKIQEAFRAQREKMQGLSAEERRDKMRESRGELDKKMKEILSKEQYEQWEKTRPQAATGGPGKKRGKKAGNN